MHVFGLVTTNKRLARWCRDVGVITTFTWPWMVSAYAW